MVCPKCISHNPDGAETCHWCGNALRQGQEATLAETVVACVACGSHLKTSANFCSQCGAARIPFHEPVDTEPELTCAACGGSINPGANYCKWCGLAVANASGSNGSVAEPTRQALRQAVVPRDKGDQRGLTREQQRIAAAQQKQLIQEQSAARKEAWRAQAEEEKKRAREAAEERARVAEERRLQKAEERAQREAERREKYALSEAGGSGDSGSSEAEQLMTIVEIMMPAIIIFVKAYIETRQPGVLFHFAGGVFRSSWMSGTKIPVDLG